MTWRIEAFPDCEAIKIEVVSSSVIAIKGIQHTVWSSDNNIVTLKVKGKSEIGDGLIAVERDVFLDLPIEVFGIIMAKYAVGQKENFI
jgi:hypothetical protein